MEENIPDKLEAYLRDLEERYKYYYEVERNKEILGVKLDIFAQSSTEHFRQVLTKKIKIDQHYTKEYAVVKAEKRFVDKNEVEEFSKFIKSLVNELVVPSVNTMYTIINGVLVSTSGFSEEAINFAEKFKFSKSFLLGLKGWCDIRLILIDLKGQKLYSNKKGEEVLSAYKVKSFLGGDKT
ncbi:hypothetical protein KKB17_01920 [bacterium]|nr:hypothetical protein [Candidatus Atribacteria bacterium]MBU4046908.1 hypothetical protein [bacterium]MBU4562148.1 hypothetical protein [bacterium]MCG2761995.1 hypothetical protein [Candidatus Atribacteria bacterium]